MAPNLVIFPAFLWFRANHENVSIHPVNAQNGGREGKREKKMKKQVASKAYNRCLRAFCIHGPPSDDT